MADIYDSPLRKAILARQIQDRFGTNFPIGIEGIAAETVRPDIPMRSSPVWPSVNVSYPKSLHDKLPPRPPRPPEPPEFGRGDLMSEFSGWEMMPGEQRQRLTPQEAMGWFQQSADPSWMPPNPFESAPSVNPVDPHQRLMERSRVGAPSLRDRLMRLLMEERAMRQRQSLLSRGWMR